MLGFTIGITRFSTIANTAMLSVNNWPLERSFQIRDGLEKAELFQLEVINSTAPEELFQRLRDDQRSEDLVVVVVAKEVCLHGENGLHTGRDDRECDHR